MYYVFTNVFNNNASMLVAERGMGGSVEASYITTCYTISGLVTGLFMGRIVVALKRKSIGFAYMLGAIGMLVTFLGHNVPMVCLGAFISGVGFCIYASTSNFHVSELSRPSAITFSVAFLAAIINLGSAFSPVIVNAITSVFSDLTETKFLIAAVVVAVIGAIALVGLKNPAANANAEQ